LAILLDMPRTHVPVLAGELIEALDPQPGPVAVEPGQEERRAAETLLGRFAVEIEELPRVGERCVVVGWPLGEEGRKLYAGTALLGEGERHLASARATWIVPLPL
jgi:hypothetical protein